MWKSLDLFIDSFVDEFQVDYPVIPESNLLYDIGIDSLTLFEFFAWVEEMEDNQSVFEASGDLPITLLDVWMTIVAAR